MAKPEWGTKRTCQSCETFFYDMKKDPITCPKCLTIYDETVLIQKHDLNAKDEFIDTELYDEGDMDDDFYLEKPADLLETLEDLEEDYHPQQSISL